MTDSTFTPDDARQTAIHVLTRAQQLTILAHQLADVYGFELPECDGLQFTTEAPARPAKKSTRKKSAKRKTTTPPAASASAAPKAPRRTIADRVAEYLSGCSVPQDLATILEGADLPETCTRGSLYQALRNSDRFTNAGSGDNGGEWELA